MVTQDERDKKRGDPHAPRTGSTRHDQDPSGADDESPDLENDQADSGPDRDHKQFGG